MIEHSTSTPHQNPIRQEICAIGPILGLVAKNKGMTQDRIAHLSGISRISVNRFFKGHTQVRADDFLRICSALGIDVEKQIYDSLPGL